VTLALVALGFVLGRTMLARREQAAGGSTHLRADVSQRIRDFRRVKVKDGRTVWELTAREAEYFEAEGQVVVERPRVSFFGADGQSVEVRGREGRVYVSEGTRLDKIELGGGIEVRVADYVLRTDKAIWVQEHDVIVSPGHVEISGAQLALDGEGMLVDLAHQKVQLLRGVKTTLRGEGGAEATGSAAAAGQPADAGGDRMAGGHAPAGEPHADAE
jgi:LPS export ABC transporter protein LptC